MTRGTVGRLVRAGALAVAILVLPAVAMATTYYVDPVGGSDTNTGTSPSSPWETIPGTRNTGNTGFLRSQWGSGSNAISTSKPVQCADTILLRGGVTYSRNTVSNGGAWRIDPAHYVSTCTKAAPITITVANSTQWPGSTGDFTFDGTGMTNTSKSFGNSGACGSGGMCAPVDIEEIDWLVFGGISDAQRFRISAVNNDNAGTAGILAYGNYASIDITGLELRWLFITGKNGVTDNGPGVEFGWVNDSSIHDATIYDWRGPGIDTGLSAWHEVRGLAVVDVVVENNGPLSELGNFAQDSYSFPLAVFSDTRLNAGGIFCVRCTSKNSYWNGSNSGGNNTPNRDAVVRYRNMEVYGAGRTATPNGSSARVGFESSGDDSGSAGALPEQSVFVMYSTFYNNYSIGLAGPHGAGAGYVWNTTFYRAGQVGATMSFDDCSNIQQVYNSVFDTGSNSKPHIYPNNCGLSNTRNNKFIPVSAYNLFHGTSDSSTLSQKASVCSGNPSKKCRLQSDCGSGEGSCVTNWNWNTYADPPGWLLNSNNKIGSAFDPQFTSTGGNCNTNYNNGAPGYGDCDFTLKPASPAIDAGTFFLKTSNAGSTATVVQVKASTPEPYQVGPGYLNWTPAKRPHIDDPRMYFIAQGAFPGIPSDTIQIENASCTNAAADLGDARRARVLSMTSSTITLDRSCTWSADAGVHLPWTGARPDMGAYEVGIAPPGHNSTTPVLLKALPVPSGQ